VTDSFSASAASPSSLSARERSLLHHGFSLQPELPGPQELRQTLSQHGLESLWPGVERACEVADKAHAGQWRDDGTPYIHHCIRAARNAVQHFGVRDLPALQAALLHDVLEDTALPPQQIEKQFGSRTLQLMQVLSKPERLPGESYADRNARYLQKIEAHGPDAVALKLADRLDNIEDTHLMPSNDKVRRYLEDTEQHYLPLAYRHFPSVGKAMASQVERLKTWVATNP
jgi:(p)ppGpp synthase/HD superfamily hydrolase